jgi:hypothetical protein
MQSWFEEEESAAPLDELDAVDEQTDELGDAGSSLSAPTPILSLASA